METISPQNSIQPTPFIFRLKNKFTKKRLVWGILIFLVLFFIISRFFKGPSTSDIQTDTIKKQGLKLTVLATGQVTSKTDLSLSFNSSGVVSKVNVKVGDMVKAGQVLASLDQKDAGARYTQAQGALGQAQANYERVLAGASNEEIVVAQKAVDAAQVTLENAKKTLSDTQSQQSVSVSNAYTALLNSGVAAAASPGNLGSATLTLSGTYTGSAQGAYKITTYSSGFGQKFQTSGLEAYEGDIKNAPVPFGSKGLYIQFSGTISNGDTWTVNIPNTQASTYVTNYNAYQAALQARDIAITAAQNTVNSASVALDQAKANLDLKRAQARPADIDSAKAQVTSAQGQVQAAAAALENGLVRAPADGTITSVDVKPGELASALKQILILQDVDNLHIEANVSEANIANIKVGQDVDVTFDALGSDRHFKAKVEAIDPASTLVSGVVNYKVTINLDKLEEVKPGMTANITILTAQKDGVLSAPLRSVLSHDGKKFVRIITDSKKKTYEEKEVILGMEADGGLVEVVSGLSAGQEIVTFVKSK